SLLIYYKYAGFFAAALGLSWAAPALPLGISFFTFQGLSYVIDMRRGQEEPGSLLDGCLYICLFPQLVAGPIVRWGDIRGQMRNRRVTWDGLARGFQRFIPGLAKKVLLADTLGMLADAAFACPDARRGRLFALLGITAFCLQLYLDFSGYSDMAIGLGAMLGFSFPENFDHPFRSASMREFWRRWHITLSRWFRDYVYIPLGGSRRGAGRTAVNLIVVFALTGLWHGAGWTFLLWGLWNGLFVVLERRWLRVDSWPRWAAHLYALAAAALGFILFRADSVPAAWRYAVSLFCGPASSAALAGLRLALTPDVALALIAAVPVSLGLKPPLPEGAARAVCLALLILCGLSIVASGYHPFLYFRF
ncbi:MAG: MBOAT family protein, partial [Clostridia bacterium]|nr:MBOAT family protein [Clostridia bacterium]